jgi:hypothetical protein
MRHLRLPPDRPEASAIGLSDLIGPRLRPRSKVFPPIPYRNATEYEGW